MLSDFYPRPPGGGRLQLIDTFDPPDKFLSTPSGWRATSCGCCCRSAPHISIHALRVEGDQGPRTRETARAISIHALRVEGDRRKSLWIKAGYISIHALRVEGDALPASRTGISNRISIHALRVEGDVERHRHAFHRCRISIHALRVEGDQGARRSRCIVRDFYPRPPGGGRLARRPAA